jgi:hypothetical protein
MRFHDRHGAWDYSRCRRRSLTVGVSPPPQLAGSSFSL